VTEREEKDVTEGEFTDLALKVAEEKWILPLTEVGERGEERVLEGK
jgi:hypothetical protein